MAPNATTGRFDGGVSVLLRNDGQGNLKAIPAWQTGLLAVGDTRAAVALALPGQKGVPSIAVSQSNGPVLVFTPNPHAALPASTVAER